MELVQLGTGLPTVASRVGWLDLTANAHVYKPPPTGPNLSRTHCLYGRWPMKAEPPRILSDARYWYYSYSHSNQRPRPGRVFHSFSRGTEANASTDEHRTRSWKFSTRQERLIFCFCRTQLVHFHRYWYWLVMGLLGLSKGTKGKQKVQIRRAQVIQLFFFFLWNHGQWFGGTNNMARTGKRTVVRCALDGLRKRDRTWEHGSETRQPAT